MLHSELMHMLTLSLYTNDLDVEAVFPNESTYPYMTNHSSTLAYKTYQQVYTVLEYYTYNAYI